MAADGRDENDGFAQLNGDGAVGLFGEFAGFNNDLLVPDWGSGFFWHNLTFLPLPPRNFSELRTFGAE